MGRRRRIVGWTVVGTLVAAVALTWGLYQFITNTERGRARLAKSLLSRVNGAFKGRGTITVGVVRDVGTQHLIADDVALRDTLGNAVVHVDHLEAQFNLRAFFDRAVLLQSLDLRGVAVTLRKEFTGPWNIAHIITGDTSHVVRTGPGFGDNVVITQLRIHDAVITTSMPWSPYPTLKGRARDSAIALRDSLHDIEHVGGGLLERRRITLDYVFAHDAILSAPNHVPASMQIDSLRGAISDPPVRLLKAQGEVRWTGDSLRLRLPVVQLPASTGSADGLIAWNQPGPVRYDVLVKARAGLSDLQWVWEVLPATGGGSAVVRLHTLANAEDVEYELRNLDVTTEGSHIRGGIAIVARPLSLELHDVDLSFDPLKSELLRRISYDAVPPEVRGVIYGRVTSRSGGPLTALQVDRIDARFVDSNVPGATSTIAGGGQVAIGAEPAARGFRVLNSRIDLRSIRALAPKLPPVDGIIEAKGFIASADLQRADVRDMDITWTDAAGNVSTVRGSARAIYGTRNPFLDATLVFDPMSMRALARIDSTVPLRGTLAGNLRAVGLIDSIQWTASLRANAASSIAMQGIAKLGTPDWHVTGNGTITAFDVHAWLATENTPVTSLTGPVNVDVRGGRGPDGNNGVREARGTLSLTQTSSEDRPGFHLLTTLSMDDRKFRIDSLTTTIGGLQLTARGSLARDSSTIDAGKVDTVAFSVRADSIGAARGELLRLARMITPMDSASAKSLREIASDTLDGDFSGSGFLFGSLPSFSVTASYGARALRVGAISVDRLFGSATASDLPHHPHFETITSADDIDGLGAIHISTAEFKIQNASPERGRIALNVLARDTTSLALTGGFVRGGDSLLVTIDSLAFDYDSVRWRNERRILFRNTAAGFVIDSLHLASSSGGVLAGRAALPDSGPIDASVRLERFPVGEIYAFAMAGNPFTGLVSGQAAMTGTRDAPLFEWFLRADSLGKGGLFLPEVTSDGAYRDKRLVARAMLVDTVGGSLSGEARVPIDLSIRTVNKRLLSDSVDAEINATQLRLGALGVSFESVDRLGGVLDGRLVLGGSLDRPFARGQLLLDDFTGRIVALGIAPYEGRMLLRADRDSLMLEQFRFRSGSSRGDTMSARGAVRFVRDQKPTMWLDLFSNNVILAHQPDGTDVVASGNLRVQGEATHPNVSGRIRIPHANIIADPIGASTALDLNSAAARELLDPKEIPVAQTASQSIAALGKYFTVSNTTVALGDEVWLRTPEASIRLTGELNVAMSGTESIALEGEISATRGIYRLNLGPVNRTFNIDSGSVRFFGNPNILPTCDISATNLVRSQGQGDIPVRVHIGGVCEAPQLTLSSTDPLYSAAPESEIISLLIFGGPTFTLDGRGQSTVQAVTNVMVPSLGGAVTGTLQRILPVTLNTLQIQTVAGQTQEDFRPTALLDNLSITAGKQLGDRTFLRVNTGVCRGSGAASSAGVSLWYGLAIEYLLGKKFTAQFGMDPGAAPCSQLGGNPLNGRQFGFDLFKEWIF